jgi:hypothetical protein
LDGLRLLPSPICPNPKSKTRVFLRGYSWERGKNEAETQKVVTLGVFDVT